MNVNRDNYESWFLDYLDGRLDAGQTGMLMSFLEFNPDLKEELEGMELLKLEAAGTEYDLKASLRKPASSPTPGNIIENFEDYCISCIEKQISPAEESMMKEIMEKDTGKRDMFSLYQATILKADESIIYPSPSRLRRRIIDIPRVRIIVTAAAAAAVLLLALPWLFRSPAENIPGSVEQNTNEARVEILPPEPAEMQKAGETGAIRETSSRIARSEIITAQQYAPAVQEEDKTTGDRQEFFEKEPVMLKRLESRGAERLETPGSTENTFLAVKSPANRPEYLSLDEYAMQQLNTRVLSNSPERKRLFWRMADAGIQKLNQLSEEDYSLARETDDSGRVRRFTFETPSFGISTPTRNPGIPGTY